jgi:hypothetical protein
VSTIYNSGYWLAQSPDHKACNLPLGPFAKAFYAILAICYQDELLIQDL